MNVKNVSFRHIREKQLNYWLRQTKRERIDYDDDRTEALDCQWHTLNPSDIHCNFFCGVGDWASHITDVLEDCSCDELVFTDEYYQQRLYRQYVRLMFFISEILNDFTKGIKVCGDFQGNEKSIKKYLSGQSLDENSVDTFMHFVNKTIKHKADMFHSKNDHLEIFFSDYQLPVESRNPVSINQIPDNFDCILIPKIETLLNIVLTAYTQFDNYISHKEKGIERVKKLNEKFGVMYESSSNEEA